MENQGRKDKTAKRTHVRIASVQFTCTWETTGTVAWEPEAEKIPRTWMVRPGKVPRTWWWIMEPGT